MTAFQEGEAAFEAEKEQNDCPYEFNSKPYMEWQAGWESADWANEQQGVGEAEDRRLDDPSHGQGAL